MAASKLTLRIDDKVVAEAKAYSRKNGTSLSRLVEGYLTFLTHSHTSVMPRVKRLIGAIQAKERD